MPVQTKDDTLYLFVLSHPIQYFSPLFTNMAKKGLNVKVIYLTDSTLHSEGNYDRQFGVNVKWDIPLLDGYDHTFIKNRGIGKPLYGFFSLINLGLFSQLLRLRKRNKNIYLQIHGWQYFSYLIAAIFGFLLRMRLLMRTDVPLCVEIDKKPYVRAIKKVFLSVYFSMFHKFLYIGEENKRFYLYYGANSKKLHFTPFSINNQLFENYFDENKHKRADLRYELFNSSAKTILYVGKLTPVKNIFFLLNSLKNIDSSKYNLLIIGDGFLRNDIEKFMKENNINGFVTGFKNQTELPYYYMCSDIFVLLSKDAWGLVMNEAMIFELPVIVTNKTGCYNTLIKNGSNGFVVNYNDEDELTKAILLMIDNDEFLKKGGVESKKIIRKFSIDETLKSYVELNS